MATDKPFRDLTSSQLHAFCASFAGWALDAFDYFLFVLALRAVAHDFRVQVAAVAQGLFWTLAMRPVGAAIFGVLAERFGRRPILMINVVSYSLCELGSAFAPSLTTLLVLRAAFGLAMGGEWGVGAALALETLPAKNRGFYSGLLQEGYVVGYLLAAVVFASLFDRIGWRGMFLVGALPALLVLYVRRTVAESPAWIAGTQAKAASGRASAKALIAHFPRLLFLVVLMACFNAFSHGSQDMYPTFLQSQHRFDASVTGAIVIAYDLGALCGGIFFGTLSERIGRRRAIVLAALLALPAIPLWAYSRTPVAFAIGGFVMQFMVQGAWGVVPAHLNELSPPSVRAVLPGFAYQLGNLAVAGLAPLQAELAAKRGGDYAWVLSWTIGIVGVAVAIVTLAGGEAHRRELAGPG